MGVEREHVQDMREDLIAPTGSFADAIDDYLRPSYEHRESGYWSKLARG
jgi:hypothetical protein